MDTNESFWYCDFLTYILISTVMTNLFFYIYFLHHSFLSCSLQLRVKLSVSSFTAFHSCVNTTRCKKRNDVCTLCLHCIRTSLKLWSTCSVHYQACALQITGIRMQLKGDDAHFSHLLAAISRHNVMAVLWLPAHVPLSPAALICCVRVNWAGWTSPDCRSVSAGSHLPNGNTRRTCSCTADFFFNGEPSENAHEWLISV